VYFVLQYIEGGELMYHVHSQGRPLELARVVFYAAELVLALEYLHSRNVIYRDLCVSCCCLMVVSKFFLQEFVLCVMLCFVF
jgi:hypothetical protein